MPFVVVSRCLSMTGISVPLFLGHNASFKVSRVNWMSPQDLDFDKIVDDAGNGNCNLPDSSHPGGGQVALIDGSARFVPNNKTAASMKASLTIAGREVTDLSDD